jgi:hypothetical protein
MADLVLWMVICPIAVTLAILVTERSARRFLRGPLREVGAPLAVAVATGLGYWGLKGPESLKLRSPDDAVAPLVALAALLAGLAPTRLFCRLAWLSSAVVVGVAAGVLLSGWFPAAPAKLLGRRWMEAAVLGSMAFVLWLACASAVLGGAGWWALLTSVAGAATTVLLLLAAAIAQYATIEGMLVMGSGTVLVLGPLVRMQGMARAAAPVVLGSAALCYLARESSWVGLPVLAYVLPVIAPLTWLFALGLRAWRLGQEPPAPIPWTRGLPVVVIQLVLLGIAVVVLWQAQPELFQAEASAV